MIRPTPLAALLLLLSPWAAAQDPPAPPETSPLKAFEKCRRRFAVMGLAPLDDSFNKVGASIEKAEPEQRVPTLRQGLDQVNEAAAAAASDPAAPEESRREILRGMAELNNSTGRWGDGKQFADRALAYNPDDRDALISRSQSNAGMRRYDAAFADANRALELAPNNADAYRARAMAHYGLGRYLEATEDARRALALEPNDRTAFFIMKLAEGKVPSLSVDALKARMVGEVQREYHGMVQQLTQAEQKRHEQPVAEIPSRTAARFVKQAAAKLAVKDYEGAVAEADRAIAEDPGSAAAYYYRAAAQSLLGRYERAVDDATRALLLNPGDIAARDARAWAFNRMGRFRDAMADSHHSLEIQPRNPYAYANLGYAHEHMGELGLMLKHLQTAAQLNPQFEPAYRDAAARHGLEPEPASASGALPADEIRARREAARRRQFLIVLGSSLFGGVLIALGVLQLAGARPRTAGAARKPGSKLEAGYELGKELGRGGMGVVYEAFDRALRRPVAVKVVREELRRDEKAKARFLEEARTVASLHHPNIVDIHSIFEDEGGLYLVFERLEGRSLDAVLAERGKLSLAEARGLLKQICAALDYAHRQGVVHRDLKPANIMITEQGLAKVMDFGISRQALEAAAPLSRAEAATVRGTPDYMAPEQEHGVVRKESDIFALGACFYEMVTGRRPFAGPHGGPQKLAADFVPPSRLEPSLGPEADRLAAWALHPDPASRLRSAKDFAALLDRLGHAAVA